MTGPPGDPPRRRHVNRGRQQVNAHVDAATRQLLDSYRLAWEQIRGELERAASDAAVKAAASGDVLDPAIYRRAARLQAALSALALQEQRLAQRHAAIIGPRVAPVVAIPPDVLRRIAVGEGLGVGFDRPTDAALEAIVARTTHRIEALSRPLPDHAQHIVARQLVQGVAAGSGPDEVARAIRDRALSAFGGQLTRALVIARTELLDASRLATVAAYKASTQVIGWVWQANVGRRTCPACLGMSGTVHPVDETLQGHPQCRCAMVPLLRGETVSNTGTLSGDQLVDRMSPEERLQSLGPARLQLLGQGVPIRRFATRADNPGWRPSHEVTPLARLPALLHPMAKPGGPTPPPKRPPRSKPSPPAPAVAGTAPVSAAVDLRSRHAQVRSAVSTATAAIDRVHTDGLLARLPFVTASSRGRTLGAYSRTVAGAGVDIAIAPNGPWSALTAVHEIGHWLDHQTMHRPGVFGSDNTPTPAWQHVMDTIRASAAVHGLESNLTDPRVTRQRDLVTHHRYLLSSRELWARAYSQYVALRSADHRLTADVARCLAEQAAGLSRQGYEITRQWQAVDFAPVADAIDLLLADLGWRARP